MTTTAPIEAIAPPRIKEGSIHAYFVYDIADTIDLIEVEKLTRAGERVHLQFRPAVWPSYIQYLVPPLSMTFEEIQVEDIRFSVRARIYDYGVVALRFSVPISGSWDEFARCALTIRRSKELSLKAAETLNQLTADLSSALCKPHTALMEDYYLYAVDSFENDISSAELLQINAHDIALLVRGEVGKLSEQEKQETLRSRFSYFEDDLVVIEWDAAFVYDRRDGIESVDGIFEFANTQLVEFRTYDARLDQEFEDIYSATFASEHGVKSWSRKAVEQRRQRLRQQLVDIQELADHASNALKIIGDAYYARVYRSAAERLGLQNWRAQVDQKIDTASSIYRYLSDQAQHQRSEFLEWIVIILILIEVLMGFLQFKH